MKLGLALAFALGTLASCTDSTRFSNSGDHFEGTVVASGFVRSNVTEGTKLCVTLDASKLQEGPGTLSSSDGRFKNAPLRPIPQAWHDPISTMAFGQGRERNLMYAITPDATLDDGGDAFAVVSLLSTGEVEVRLLRGAPGETASANAHALFAVFQAQRTPGGCPF